VGEQNKEKKREREKKKRKEKDILPANEALDIEDGVLGVKDGLVLGSLPNQLLMLREGYHRGCHPVPPFVGDDLHLFLL
jgi:hypothetical protein